MTKPKSNSITRQRPKATELREPPKVRRWFEFPDRVDADQVILREVDMQLAEIRRLAEISAAEKIARGERLTFLQHPEEEDNKDVKERIVTETAEEVEEPSTRSMT